MKKILSLLFLSIFAFEGQAQDACGTPPPPPEIKEYLMRIGEDYRTRQRTAAEDTFINVPLRMHIVTSPSGSRYSYNTMLTVICELNDKYAPAKIRFWLHSVNFLNEPNLYNHTSFNTGSQMMLQYNQSLVCNVYFVNLSPIGLCGYAFFPGTGPGPTVRNGGLMMSVGCSGVGNSTLAHEMGHYLALPHPFDGTEGDPSSPISERITRSSTDTANGRLPANCSWAGDFFCDTPSDFIGTRWSCTGSIPVQRDVNDDLFEPDETLYMSYSLDNCQNRFSPEQMNTMRTTLAGNGTTPGSRFYLQGIPMPAFDTIVSNSTPLFPNDPSIVLNSDYPVFRWSRAAGATHYLFRIIRNGSAVFEQVVTDTVFDYAPFFGLTTNAAYTWNVRPYNHAWTCMGPSASGSFRGGQNWGLNTRKLESDKILIYPTVLENGQSLQISLEGLEDENLNLEIIDLKGAKVYSSTLFGNSNEAVSLEFLKAGLYHVRISGNGLLKQTRISKL